LSTRPLTPLEPLTPDVPLPLTPLNH
jgi:hypothetical protein